MLLEQTRFESTDVDEQPNLHPIDQAILLAQCLDVQNTNPKDGLTSEQMKPYVARVLTHPNNWMIYSTALFQRARLEFTSIHSYDRALLQVRAT